MCQHLQKTQKIVRRELRVKPTLERKPSVFNVGAISVHGLFSKSRERFELETQDPARKSEVYSVFFDSSNSLSAFLICSFHCLEMILFSRNVSNAERVELRKERGRLSGDVDGFCSCCFVRLKGGTCSKMTDCL